MVMGHTSTFNSDAGTRHVQTHMPLSDQDYAEVVAFLRDPDPDQRVTMLRVLRSDPSGDSRLVPILTDLLEDRHVALLGIPLNFGEVRWLAAHVLAAEYRQAKVTHPIVMRDVPIPMTSNALSLMAEARRITVDRTGISGQVQQYDLLRAMGAIKTIDLTL